MTSRIDASAQVTVLCTASSRWPLGARSPRRTATWNASGIARPSHAQAGQKFPAPANAQMMSSSRPIATEMLASSRRIIRQLASRSAARSASSLAIL